MYFWLCECLWFIKLVWATLLGVPKIKHLVKSFSSVELTAAGNLLEIAIMAGSIIFLLAFRMATEGIIRTLKWVCKQGNAAGQDLPPTHRGFLQDCSTQPRKKAAFQTKWKPKQHD